VASKIDPSNKHVAPAGCPTHNERQLIEACTLLSQTVPQADAHESVMNCQLVNVSTLQPVMVVDTSASSYH